MTVPVEELLHSDYFEPKKLLIEVKKRQEGIAISSQSSEGNLLKGS